ncbi:hypothetical protein FALBO_24 [Fusarium albosuccineum]|uniref:Uncharacterized protein n=1 Tax=Fusarium albosuccineum TaxID=1237068 RepID=A0A8H4LRP4_9HYPO|nr:hypothetical protein FALBO_24 [Fusarium albosuccineum]
MALATWGITALLAASGIHPALAQSEQQPLADTDTTDKIKRPEYPARDAELTIYNSPKWPCVPKTGHPKTELDVPINSCVSADFTLDNNVHLAYPGLCSGGTRAPYIAIYKTSDCTGEHSHPDWYDRRFAMAGPGHCLSKAVWGKDITPPEGQWSMKFLCDEDDEDEVVRVLKVTLPAPPPPPPPKPAKPRPKTASVSDSACFIPGIGMAGAPRFIFQRTEADTCMNVAPKHMLKIYRNALCPNGTEALFARFEGRGCSGSPVVLKEVDDDMIATNDPSTCIKMGGEDASSYAFWCTGDLNHKSVKGDLFPDDGDGVRLHYTYGNNPQNSRSKSAATSARLNGDSRILGLVVGAIAIAVSSF